jgi:predicted RNA-binding Zn ribbon-like protein
MTSGSSTLPPPLVIAGHLAIDFVNSRATPGVEPIDWLQDGASLLGWASSLSLFPQPSLMRLGKTVTPRSLGAVAEEARELREQLRGQLSHPERLRTSSALWKRVNDILARGSAFHELQASDEGPKCVEVERLDQAGQLLVPLAKAIGRLVEAEDLGRLRACEGAGCTLWFVDRSKAGQRRFCSPSVCGNRAKVAAFRSRQKDE